MLCLTRRDNQDTILRLPDGREIVVRLVWGRHGRAMIGIDAPPDVHIARAELPDGRFVRRPSKSPAYDNGCSICRDPNCQDPCGKH